MSPLNKKKQFIIFGLCSLLALAICFATLVVTVRNVDEGRPVSQELPKESRTQLQNDTKALCEYILRLTEYAGNNAFVKADVRTEVSVDDSSIKVSSEENNKLFIYFKNKVSPMMDSLYPDDFKGAFGTVSDKMLCVDLKGIGGLEAEYSQGQVNEEGVPILDDEGNVVDEDFYFLTFTVDGKELKDGKSKESFRVADMAAVQEEAWLMLSPDCNITFKNVEPQRFVIRAKINRFTDELSNIEIQRNYRVNAGVEFFNTMSVFGASDVEFIYTVTQVYDYYYAGISFLENSFRAEVGDEISLSVNAVIENDSEYDVQFISSDETIATVDEMGYVQILKDEPVVITVKLMYLGEAFTDECYINSTASEQ